MSEWWQGYVSGLLVGGLIASPLVWVVALRREHARLTKVLAAILRGPA